MHTFTYRKQPIIIRPCYYDQCESKGISLKECPYEFRSGEGGHRGIQQFRPVAIERRSYSDSPVVLYAVIYRNVSTGAITVKHAWGKHESVTHLPGRFGVGE